MATFLLVLGVLIGANTRTHAATVYVPLGSAGEIIVVDAGDDLTTGTVVGVEDVHGLAAVAEEPKLWVVDAATLRVRRKIPIRGKGHQMAVSQG